MECLLSFLPFICLIVRACEWSVRASNQIHCKGIFMGNTKTKWSPWRDARVGLFAQLSLQEKAMVNVRACVLCMRVFLPAV